MKKDPFNKLLNELESIDTVNKVEVRVISHSNQAITTVTYLKDENKVFRYGGTNNV